MSKELIDNAKDLREIGEGIREPICFAAADELESLRAQLKEAQAEIERLADSNNLHLDRVEYLESKLRCHSSYAKRPILYTDGVNGEQCCRDDLWAVSTEELNAINEQLAASQAREVQLREALNKCRAFVWEMSSTTAQKSGFNALYYPAIQSAGAALNSSDTTALEAIVQKAGEVMRERCAKGAEKEAVQIVVDGREERAYNNAVSDCAEAIRALPGVTMEDLK